MEKRGIFRPPKLRVALLIVCLVFIGWSRAAASPADEAGTPMGQTGTIVDQAGRSADSPKRPPKAGAQPPHPHPHHQTERKPVRAKRR